ncbi:MAG: YCF48-related protein [Bacteroidota bacterium]
MKRPYILSLILIIIITNVSAQKKIADVSNVDNAIDYNGRLFFTNDDQKNGNELWQTDGTAGGTFLFRDIYEGAPSANPTGFFKWNGKLYFNATDGPKGRTLWETDGTIEGTRSVLDIDPDNRSEIYNYKGVVDGKWLIITDYQALLINPDTKEIECLTESCSGLLDSEVLVSGNELFTILSDNRAVMYLPEAKSFRSIANADFNEVRKIHREGDHVYLFNGRRYSNNLDLGRYNLDTDEFEVLGSWELNRYEELEIGYFASTPEGFYFNLKRDLDNGNDFEELLYFDHSNNEPVVLKSNDYNRHDTQSGIDLIKANGNDVYFIASKDDNNTLWVTDGTVSGTRRFNDTPIRKISRSTSNYNGFRFLKDEIYAESNGLLIMDINDPSNVYRYETEYNSLRLIESSADQYFFTLKDEDRRTSLWVSEPSAKINSTRQSWSLPGVSAGSCSEAVLSLQSIGRAELFVSKMILTGESFYLSDKINPAISMSESNPVKVHFFPESIGEHRGELKIFTNDPSEPVYTIDLYGIANEPFNADDACLTTIRPIKILDFKNAGNSEITLDNHSLTAGNSEMRTIGNFLFDQQIDENVAYSLVEGSGSDDNGLFTIAGSSLSTQYEFNFDGKSTFVIRVKAVKSNESVESILILNVADSQNSYQAAACVESDFIPLDRVLNDIVIIDRENIIAVGDQQVLTSDDAGESWEYVTYLNKDLYQRIYYFDSDEVYITGKNSILKSDDKGNSWRSINLPSVIEGITDISFGADTFGIVVSSDNILYTSVNGGVDWKETARFSQDITAMEFLNGTKGYIGDDNGTIYVTNDGGLNWNDLPKLGIEEVQSIARIFPIDDETIIYKDYWENHYISRDNGNNWRRFGEQYQTIDGLRMVSETEGYRSVGRQIFKTTDAGNSWSLAFEGKPTMINAFDYHDGLLIGVGQSQFTNNRPANHKSILKNENDSWKFVSNITFPAITERTRVQLVGEKDIWIISNQRSDIKQLYKSTDRGTTFEEVIIPEVPYIYNLSSLDENKLVFSSYDHLFLTTDGGETWLKKDKNNLIRQVIYLDDNTLLSLTVEGMLISKDLGDNWTSVSIPNFRIEGNPGIKFFNENVGFLKSSGRLWKTVDGGYNWTLIVDVGFIRQFQFLDENTGYYTNIDGEILKTVNGGVNWSTIEKADNSLNVLPFFLDEQQAYGLSQNSGRFLYKSTDCGISWVLIDQRNDEITGFFTNDEGDTFLYGVDGVLERVAPQQSIFPLNILGEKDVIAEEPYLYNITDKGYSNNWQVAGGEVILLNNNSVLIAWDSTANEHTLSVNVSDGCGESVLLTTDIMLKDGRAFQSQDDEEDEDEDEEDVITSLDELIETSLIYPNPTEGVVYFDRKLVSGDFQVTLYTIGGKFVDRDKSDGNSIDLSGLDQGLYILRIFKNGAYSSHRVLLR